MRACVRVFVGVKGWGELLLDCIVKFLLFCSEFALFIVTHTLDIVILATALQSNMIGCCAVASIPRKSVVCVVCVCVCVCV